MSREIDARIAVEVMGWPKVGESKNGRFSIHEHPEHGRISVGPKHPLGNFTSPWSPSEDPAAAEAAAAKERGQ